MLVQIDSIDDFLNRHASEQEQLQKERPSECLSTRLPPYLPTSFHQEVVFSIERNSTIVALAGVMRDDEPDTLLVSYITVDRDHRDEGLASALVRAIVDYMREHELRVLAAGTYTELGDKYLKKVVRRHANDVKITERGILYTPSRRTPEP